MKTIGLLNILLIFLAISCEKDKKDQHAIAGEIVIGDYSNMIVSSYDTILSQNYYTNMELDLDIDKDGVNDIRLVRGFWGGLPSTGWNPYSVIKSLHNDALILGHYTADTLFLNIMTILDDDHPTYGILVTEYYNYTCHRIDDKDIIQEIYTDRFKITPKDQDNIITKSDIFKADTIILMDDVYGDLGNAVDNGEDTIVIRYHKYSNDCYTFPQDEIKYIGLKLVNGQREYLGWIKILLMNKNDIVILESAIQE